MIKGTVSLLYRLKGEPEKYISLNHEEKIIDIFLLASGEKARTLFSLVSGEKTKTQFLSGFL